MSAKMLVGDRIVGEGHPCFVIAEAGVNHNGSLDMALKLVDVAVAAGADAVKFQKRSLKDLYPKELLDNPNTAEWAFRYMLPILQQSELTDDDFFRIKAHCDERGIRFMCTPWDEASLELIEKLGVEVYKVASADLVNSPLLAKIAATGKPIILSTGMATIDEIEATCRFLESRRVSFALLHAVSTYPAPFESLNLRFIETLKQFGVPVGYSGHERGIAIPLVALTLGASIIEKHVTLDRTLPGPDHPASLEPAGMEKLVRDIRHAEMALGSAHKQLNAMERLNRQVLRKSLVAARDLANGTVITEDMIATMGPGKGLSPQYLDRLLGIELHRDMKAEDYFTEEDLVPPEDREIISVGLRRDWWLKTRFHDLSDALRHRPRLVEMHFSEDDVDHPFEAPPEPYAQRLYVHAPEFVGSRLLDMCAVDETHRAQSIEMAQRTIDKAMSLQPHFAGGQVAVVIHVGGMSMDESSTPIDKLIDLGVESVRRLDRKDVILLPENLPPRPWYFGGQWFQNLFIRPEHMTQFCDRLGLGMTLDVSHAKLYCNWSRTSLADFVRHCQPYARHFHIADASGIDGEGVQIGEGDVNWEEVLGIISGGENFTWVPEIWSGHLHKGAGFIEAIHRLKKLDKL
jgi:sialic acid synthase SpsE/sugar phosphate isomerase/epimerase